MSHAATNWAIRQRGIRPALKVVLWHLCDCHNPAYGGSFPSQEYLSEQCEIPRSTLNVYLDQLEAAGLIAREQRRQSGSMKQERTRYFFPFDPEFEGKRVRNPSPETGHGLDEAESRISGEPSPETGESRVQNLDSNLVREPVKEPVIEREGARAGSDESETATVDDRRRIERDFKAWYRTWPTSLADSEKAAREAWAALSAEDRASCLQRTPAFIEAVKKIKGKFTFSSVYLNGKAWEKLDDPKSDVALPAVHNPFSRAWMAVLLANLQQAPSTANLPAPTKFQQGQIALGGDAAEAVRIERLQKYGWPRVNTMYQRAYDRQGVTVPALLASASEGFVRVDEHSLARWKAAFERRGWPWLPNTGHEWFFFPEGDPDEALAKFSEATARDRGDDDAA